MVQLHTLQHKISTFIYKILMSAFKVFVKDYFRNFFKLLSYKKKKKKLSKKLVHFFIKFKEN